MSDEEMREYISRWMKARELSFQQFSVRVGIPASYLQKMFKGDRRVSKKLMAYFRIAREEST